MTPGKWKLERVKGESFGHKLKKERTFRNFNKVEQGILLCMVLFVGFFAVAYGYYENIYQNQLVNTCNYGGTYPNCAPLGNDPFSILYNGTLTDSPSGPFGPIRVVSNALSGRTTGASLSMVVTDAAHETIIVTVMHDSGSLCPNTLGPVTDSQSNGPFYTCLLNQGINAGADAELIATVWYVNTGTNSGSDTITVTGCGCGEAYFMAVSIYSGVANIGNTAGQSVFVGGAIGGSTSVTLSSISNIESVIFQIFGFTSDFDCAHSSSHLGTSVQTLSNCGFGTIGTFSIMTLQLYSTQFKNPSRTQTIDWTISGPDTGNQAGSIYAGIELVSYPIMPCPGGYACSNAGVDQNNNLNLSANATYPGIALSKSPVDVSTCASKECLIYESWRNVTTWTNSKPFAMFLSLNQTLPTQANYDPLQDPNVALVMICYPQPSKTVNCYLYEAKTQGQSLLTASGEPANPGITTGCPQTTVIYGCLSEEVDQNSANFYALATVLNYTGASDSSTTTGHAGQSGTSFFAMVDGAVQSINLFSGNPGAQPPLLPCADADNAYGCGSYTLPFLNMNGGPFYIGFYASAGQNSTIQFGTSYGTAGTAAFSHNANSIWYWIPLVTTSVQGTTDTGGFLGFLGHVVGSAFSQAGNFLGSTLGPALNIAGSLMGAVLSAFVQAVSQLIQVYRSVLNYIGNQLGFGNIGDLLFNTLTSIGTFIVQGFTTIGTVFVLVGQIITGGYFAFLAGALALLAVLLPFAFILWNIVFSGAITVSMIFFMDYLYGMTMIMKAIKARKSSLKAFLSWISLNVFLMTFLFEVSWYVFDVITRPIHRVKQTVDPVG